MRATFTTAPAGRIPVCACCYSPSVTKGVTPVKAFLTWLKSLFIHQKEERPTMSEALNDTAAGQQTTTADPAPATTTVAAPVTTAAEGQTGVKDLKAALSFLDDAIKHLGEGARDELIALAQKYL